MKDSPKAKARKFAKRYARGNFLMEDVYVEVYMAGYAACKAEFVKRAAKRASK